MLLEDACGLVLVPWYGAEGNSATSKQRAREVSGTCARSWAALALPGAVRCSQPGGPCGWTHGRGSQWAATDSMDPGRFLLGKYRRYAVCSLSLCVWTYARGTGYLGGTFLRAEAVGFGAKLPCSRCISPQPQALLPPRSILLRACTRYLPWPSRCVPMESSMMQLEAAGREALLARYRYLYLQEFFSLCGRSGPLVLSDPLQCSHRGHRSRGISRIAQGSQVLLLACTTAQHMSGTGNLCHALIAARIHVMRCI